MSSLNKEQKLSSVGALANRKQFKEAEMILKDMLEDSPNDDEVVAAVGALALAQENTARALDVYKRLVEMMPNKAQYWTGLSHAHRMNKDNQSALEAQAKAIRVGGGHGA